ncbi:pyridoxamine 5'-phosphate oxidase family protein [Marinomonas sp. THO17]|uniref:pyridoxamine 5'-phosphate oxidase family protein n=1 Tax=Marinomonas sp. THO17 TaxID=3149048 RepID=UPI00336BF822
MSQPQPSPFHHGETTIQQRVGVAEAVVQRNARMIRSELLAQHRTFFSNLSMLVVCITDHDGMPWAIPLFGNPGFIQSPSVNKLEIMALPTLAELLKLDFMPHKKIGLLGIELHTRRRNRVNGTIQAIDINGFSVLVEQSFGNCPQYIQKRSLSWENTHANQTDINDLSLSSRLSPDAIDLIQVADTFFIGSRSKSLSSDSKEGLDVSHRGGKPGFVKLEGDTLCFPDFKGNRFYNTLGNIQSDGRVGLFFPDFKSGNTVFMTGTADVIWDSNTLAEFEGAESIVAIQIHSSLFIERFLPMRGEVEEPSPWLKTTGTWSQYE